MYQFVGKGAKGAGAVLLAVLALLVVTPQAGAQTLSKQELKCSDGLGKGSAKLAKIYGKSMAKCLDADISGKTVGACPDTKGQAKIDKIADKLVDKATSDCGSVCSVSNTIPCVTDSTCPPLPNNGSNGSQEKCSAGAALILFDMVNLGFPGPFCAAELAKPVETSDEIGTCVAGVTETTAQSLIDLVYGDITNASMISSTAAKCLSSISKAAQKLSGTIVKGVSKCRSCVNKTPDKCNINPNDCQTDDPKLAAKIQKAKDKLASTIDAKCSDTDIVELDICGQGPGAVTTRVDAADCLIPAVSEVSDSPAPVSSREYAGVAIIDAAWPDKPSCGDGVVNQGPNISQQIGEECDGADDSACPGNCLPPGDAFQCTCSAAGGAPARTRFLADGATADLDNGHTGGSHNNGVTQDAGYTVEYANCDCDSMDANTCIGVTGDPICDTAGRQQPTCSWDPLSATRCDDHGDGNLQDKDEDCWICDEFAANAGTYCEGSADCDGQCYDAGGTPTMACPNGQEDCINPGDVCRGSCDKSQECIILTNGAPLPISSEGTAVCVLTLFRENITGTMNIVTGEHETNIRQFSIVHLGNNNKVPCPVCGGFCVGGSSATAGDICTGTCDVSGDRCRFDSDCPMGEVCTESSPDCTGGGVCNLSLVCSGGTNKDLPCEIDAQTTFGTTSAACPPLPSGNVSGEGLEINFLPQTSEAVSLAIPAGHDGSCSALGFENYSCTCPQGAGNIPTKPNGCAFACNAGAEYGQGCAVGSSASGFNTTCSNSAAACDEDADCPGGTCSDNPMHCTNVGFEFKLCTSDADCGGVPAACVDACPSGVCVPLCEPGEGGDPEEGYCIAGPDRFVCQGRDFLTCTSGQASAACTATCSGSLAPCSAKADCPSGETCNGPCAKSGGDCEAGIDAVLGTADDVPFAGTCGSTIKRCFVEPVEAEGGDIFNHSCINDGFLGVPCTTDTDCGGVPGGCYLADSTNIRSVSVFCIPPTGTDAIDGTAGLGGPGRLRQRGINATNGFTSLP